MLQSIPWDLNSIRRAGFDFGISAGGALEEPVGLSELLDEMTLGFAGWIVGLEPGDFESFEVFWVVAG